MIARTTQRDDRATRRHSRARGLHAVATLSASALLASHAAPAHADTLALDSFTRASGPALGTNESGHGSYNWRAFGSGTASIENGELVVRTGVGGTMLVLLDTSSMLTDATSALSLSVQVRNLSGAATPPKGRAGLVARKQGLDAAVGSSWCALVNQALGLTTDFSLWRGDEMLASSDAHAGRLDSLQISLDIGAQDADGRALVVDGTQGVRGSPRVEHRVPHESASNPWFIGVMVRAEPGQQFSVAFDDFLAKGPDFLPAPSAAALAALAGVSLTRRRRSAHCPAVLRPACAEPAASIAAAA